MPVFFDRNGLKTPTRSRPRRNLPSVAVQLLNDPPQDRPLKLPDLARIDALAERRDVRGLLHVHADVINQLSVGTFSADDALTACDVIAHLESVIDSLAPEGAVNLADGSRGPQTARNASQRPLEDRVADAREALKPSGKPNPDVQARAADALRTLRGGK